MHQASGFKICVIPFSPYWYFVQAYIIESSRGISYVFSTFEFLGQSANEYRTCMFFPRCVAFRYEYLLSWAPQFSERFNMWVPKHVCDVHFNARALTDGYDAELRKKEEELQKQERVRLFDRCFPVQYSWRFVLSAFIYCLTPSYARRRKSCRSKSGCVKLS